MLELTDLFDESYYLDRNLDVSQAVNAGTFTNGLEHFQQFGRTEGRDPSELFDTEFYLQSNVDIEVAFIEGVTTPIEHFLEFGQVENRDPIPEFDTNFYLVNNSDVDAVVPDFITAYQHYLEFGQTEGRSAVGNEGSTSDETILHPLDPLTATEIETAVAAIVEQQNLTDLALFPNVYLLKPPKSEVLAFTEGSDFQREAFVVVLDRAQNQTYEAIVDLNTRTVTSWEEIPGAQPLITEPEFDILDEVVRADERWQQAMLDRGITDFDSVVVDGWAPGNLTSEESESGARLLRALTYYQGEDQNWYRPIEGLLVTVNLNSETVDTFLDTGIVPFSEENFDFTADAVEQTRETPKPLRILQPEGTSFDIAGNEITWQNWNFRYTIHPREGLVLHQVNYQDGEELRPILYRGGLSEMVVPYADTDTQWVFRNAFDVGEYGLGRLANWMELGQDVPENAVLLDAVFADDFGESFVAPGAAAIYERDGGVLWQHYDYIADEIELRRSRELVMGMTMTIGNYDYGMDWIFHQDGSIEVEVLQTGIVLPKGTTTTDAGALSQSDRFSKLVAPNILGPNHQHFFNFRLDLDVDGTANSAVEMNVNALPVGSENPDGNAFVMEATPLTTEAQAMRNIDLSQSRKWNFVSSDKQNDLGGSIGYVLVPEGNTVPYASSESPIRQRAGFLNNHVWVTQYDPEEIYAAGDYPNQSEPGQGLPEYVSDNDAIANEDLVLWYTLGNTHIVRPEDWPVMPVMTSGFKLIPRGFFDRNPALDVPPEDIR